jgi:hypothetical protein
MSRRARGLPTTFIYYDWDENSHKIILTDRDGSTRLMNCNPERDETGGMALERVIHREMREGVALPRERAQAMAYTLHNDNRYELRVAG